MGETLKADAKLLNGRMKYECTAGDHPAIITDYVPPIGNNEGYTPLQVFLLSFAACAGGAVSMLLQKFGKSFSDFSVHIEGTRRDEHPTCFSSIRLEFRLTSADATEEDMKLAIAKAEELICPVWAMVKGNVEVSSAAVVKKP